MFLLRDFRPQMVRSDNAFIVELVRRLRALSDVNVGTWFDHGSGRVKRVYRELPPRVSEVIGRWVIPVIGAAGVRLAELERRDQDAEQAKTAAFKEALGELE